MAVYILSRSLPVAVLISSNFWFWFWTPWRGDVFCSRDLFYASIQRRSLPRSRYWSQISAAQYRSRYWSEGWCVKMRADLVIL